MKIESESRPESTSVTTNIEFMLQLEGDYRRASGLTSRAQYKIFYGQAFPAPILTLGLNPGGVPEATSEDGTRRKDGSPASASASYFEGMENDVLDCEWRENTGLRKLLLPMVGNNRDRFRREVVKTNIAFRRSRAVGDINLAAATQEATPFLARILDRVRPQVIILTGSFRNGFLCAHAADSHPIPTPPRLVDAPAFVFSAAKVRLKAYNWETTVVQVGHASRFAWTYDKYCIPAEITKLMNPPAEITEGRRQDLAMPASVPIQRSSGANSTPGKRPGNPSLRELEAQWVSRCIVSEFHRVHHFSDPRFSGKRETLSGFIAWCDPREIRSENAQTLKRAFDVARRMEEGQPLNAALKDAWATFPVVRR